MTHISFHPSYVDGCIGCKVNSIGYDGKHLTKSTVDENRATITEHRSGCQDVTVRPRTVSLTTQVKEL